jgi:vitamin B12 transporter
MSKKRFAALVLCLCLPITLTLADTELEMKEIVVTATRTEEEVLTAPGHVTVLSEEEISRSGAKNLADLLTRQSGIKVNDYGAEGAVKSISIRGSATAQVLILVNGVRLNDSLNGGFDLSDIPLTGVERIEIVRGGSSALYGSDAMAGVINIITKKDAKNRLKVKIENGSYIPRSAVEVSEGPTQTSADTNWLDLVDTQKLSLEYSTVLANIDLVASGGFTRAANEYVWNDTKYIGDYRRRINADLLSGNGYLSVSSSIGEGSAGVTGSANYKEVGSPGQIDPTHFSLSTDARQQTATAQGQMFFNTDHFFLDILSFDINGFYKYFGLDYSNPPYDPSSVKLHTVGIDIVQEFNASDILSLIYGGNIIYEGADSTEIDIRRRFSGGGFLEFALYPIPGLSITPTLRYDFYSDYAGSLNYKLNIVYGLNTSVSLKLSGGKSYRIPTLNDLYWPDDPINFMRGKPNLTPETGYFGELGFSFLTDRLRVNTFVFTRYVTDAIVWGFNLATFYYEPLNVGESLFPGAEFDAEMNLINNFWLTAAYTFIYSYLLEGFSGTYGYSDNKRAPYVPVHSADAALEYRGGKTMGGLYFEFVDKAYKDDENTIQIDGHCVFNAQVRHQLTDCLTLALKANNIFNKVYEVLADYTAPPLSFWLGAELTVE